MLKNYENKLLLLLPKSWLLIWNFIHGKYFFMSLSTAMCRMKKVLFSGLLIVFHCFQPCKLMRKHGFTGQNTQHLTLDPGSCSLNLIMLPPRIDITLL